MNPAVTLAFAVVRRLPWRKVPVYWTAQMLGAFVASACVYAVYYGEFNVHSHTLKIDKVIGRTTQTRLCVFTVAARKPLEFCSDEHAFERFIFFVGYNGRCFVNCFKQWLILDEIFVSVFVLGFLPLDDMSSQKT